MNFKSVSIFITKGVKSPLYKFADVLKFSVNYHTRYFISSSMYRYNYYRIIITPYRDSSEFRKFPQFRLLTTWCQELVSFHINVFNS